MPLAGAVLVALNTRLDALEIAYLLEHSGVKLAIVDTEFRDLFDEANSGLGLLVIDSRQYDALRDAAQPHRVDVADERSLVSINYTSGTTGRPKGVMYYHRGAYLQALAMAYHAKLTRPRATCGRCRCSTPTACSRGR
ncbi:AMP-binding protein [Saccharopolyspora sp. NPDC000995]